MVKLPLVSIITPTYNRADYLPETMESVLSQDYAHIEYIVIDDGSTDNTKDLVEKYQRKKYPGKKLHYIQQQNMGETKTVNKAFKMARGEILVVINSDDLLLPHVVKEMVAYFQKHPNVLAVYPDWHIIDDVGRVRDIVKVANYDFITMLKEHYCMPGPGTFFRKKALTITNGRSEKFRYVADFAFWLKIGMHGPLAHIPKPLAAFRVHSESQGIAKKGEEMAKEHKRLVDWVFQDPDLPKSAQKVRQVAYASAYFHAAKESGSTLSKAKYYGYALLTNPFIFARKMLYEAIKIKHVVLQRILPE